jgi:hypothetical protein
MQHKANMMEGCEQTQETFVLSSERSLVLMPTRIKLNSSPLKKECNNQGHG